MPELLHYFYFLASDKEVVHKAWRQLIDHFGLPEVEAHQFDDGPVLSRLATSDQASAAISISGHLAVLELQLKQGETNQQRAELEMVRRNFADLLFELVGESTFLLGEAFGKGLDGEPLNIPTPQGMLSVFPGNDERPRLYLFSAPKSEGKRFIRERVVPLDGFSFEVHKELSYLEEQHQSVLQKMDEANRQIAEILRTKGNDVDSLEDEVDAISATHAELASYGSLMSSALHRLRIESARFEEMRRKISTEPDPFFQSRERARLKRLAASFNATQGDLSRALANAKAAIEVVKSRVDLGRSRTNLDLQKQISSLMHQNVHIQEEARAMGVAASMIEFFLVLFYGLGVWKMLAGEELVRRIPLALRSVIAVLFSLAVVGGTHGAAKAVQEKTARWILIWGLAIGAMIAVAIWVSILSAH
ncbi:MAG: hypothetical protein P8Y63_00620 [Deltaproteobacteria bacterium]|jgi:hypothetical protein